MGACSSQPAAASAPALAQQQTVTAQPIEEGPPRRSAGQGRQPIGKFQIKLSGNWKDYDREEDMVLKRAFLVGQRNAKFSLRGQQYEYSFANMMQKNLGTGKAREIRPPRGMTAPQAPLLPSGPMVVIKVPKGSAGKTITVDDPNNPGQKVQVNVPQGAKAGQKMAVPVPEKGETTADVQKKQRGHSTAAKIAMGVGACGAISGLAVGGVILGDHLSGGAVAEAIGGAFGEGAGEAMADATAWTAEAVGDAGDWFEGAGADIGEAAEDAVDWLGDAAEDAGDFVMSLF